MGRMERKINRQKNKAKNIIIGVGAILVVVVCIVVGMLMAENNKFRYNQEGAVGNLTGNLFNGGTFCQYEDKIYFANPADNGTLYSMNEDGTDIKKLYDDTASYIQVINGYIYYVRTNDAAEEEAIRGTLYGIYRLKIGSSHPVTIYNGIVDSMVVCGNYIYFKAYDEKNLVEFKKVKVDGKELSVVSSEDYDALTVWNNDVYFTTPNGGGELKYVNAGSDAIHTSSEGNYFMPSFSDGYFYYIDLSNDMKLCRMSLTSNNVTILDEGRCINYNVSSEYGVIYYQLEDEDGHRLRRMDIFGTNKTTIAEGDYCNIHITKNYTYYNKYVSAAEKPLYCVETNGNITRKVDFVSSDED